VFSRRHLLVSAWVAAASAQAQDDAGPRRVILDASRALQAGNAARFLGYFDRRRFGGFSDLARRVSALLDARTVASSVDVLSIADGPGDRAAEADWLLQLTPIGGPGEVETRRQTIELTLSQHSSGEWRIASLAPVEFFRIL